MTLATRLRAIVDALPDSSAVTLQCAVIRVWLGEEAAEEESQGAEIVAPASTSSWRERLWTAPEGTTIGVRELMEALGRSSDWVYRAVSVKRSDARGRHPLPCAKLDGVLTFEVGAVRRWLKASSATVNPERPLGGLSLNRKRGTA